MCKLVSERMVNDMSGGEIAALIAAIAFLLLVVFLISTLLKVNKALASVNETVAQTTKTLDVVTGDVDVLTQQVEALLVKSNTLLDDVNGKVADTDPLFKAIGELGETVSDLNSSSRHLVASVKRGGKRTAEVGIAGRAMRLFRRK